MTDPRPDEAAEDAFTRALRSRLHDITDRLEPQRTFDDVVCKLQPAGHADGDAAAGHGGDEATQRRTWARAGAIALAAASVVGVLTWSVRSPTAPTVASPSTPGSIASSVPATEFGTTEFGTTEFDITAPASSPETFPVANPAAVNLLVVGTDNGACIDPESPFAGGFGEFGSRSDTIMMIHLDPLEQRAAILSFPRDLWVPISGRAGSGRINSAHVDDDPSRLIDTIFRNFGIWPDHFVQIDFCGFSAIVDAVGGVAVPFERPVRDVDTGLDVPTAGCVSFDGDQALAYVRSRKLETLGVDGEWRTDPLADLSRIARQQDFVRRVLLAVGDDLTDVTAMRSLIAVVQAHLVVDQGLTLATMLGYIGVLSALSPDDLSTYQIEVTDAIVSGNAVLLPQLGSEHMRAVLALFGAEPMPTGDVDEPGATGEVAPVVSIADTKAAIVPPLDVTC